MQEISDVAEYTVRYDGVIHDERTMHDDSSWGSGYITTGLGCPSPSSSLSTGATVGIIFGCLAFASVIGGGVYYFYKKGKVSNDEVAGGEDERQEPLLP